MMYHNFRKRKSVETIGERLSPLLVLFSYNHSVIVRHRGGPFRLSDSTAALLSSFSHARISKKEISRFGRHLRRLNPASVYVRLSRDCAHTYARVRIHERARPHFRKIMQLFPASWVSLRHIGGERGRGRRGRNGAKGDRVRPPEGDI